MPPTDSRSANRIVILAEEIRHYDQLARRGTEEAAEAALQCGKRLLEAKASRQYGHWGSWCRGVAKIPTRTATRYMKVAMAGLDSATLADLGISKAEQMLSTRTRRTGDPAENAVTGVLKILARLPPAEYVRVLEQLRADLEMLG